MAEMIVREMTTDDIPAYHDHVARHRLESGRGDPHFMPFEPDDPSGPTGLSPESLQKGLDEISWQRWFIAQAADSDTIVGHVNLKGDHLATGLHRCELGIGIERQYRRGGLGRRLIQQALDFARAQDRITWVDLRVFGHNRVARSLYEDFGFEECGCIADRFRISGQSIDDVIMVLDVS